MTFPFLDEITALVQRILGDRLTSGIEDYMDLFAEDGVLELPFPVSGETKRLEGKAAIAGFLETIRGRSHPQQLKLVDRHETPGDTVIAEYRGRVHRLTDDTWFEQRYIAVFRLRVGRLILFRKYFDPSAPACAKPA